MLPRHARCFLSRLRCNRHSFLLGCYFSRTGRIENLSCSACGHSSQDTTYLILHCPATDSLRRSLFGDSHLSTTFGPNPGELRGFWGSMVFRHAPIPRKGSGNQQQQQNNVYSNSGEDWQPCANDERSISLIHQSGYVYFIVKSTTTQQYVTMSKQTIAIYSAGYVHI